MAGGLGWDGMMEAPRLNQRLLYTYSDAGLAGRLHCEREIR